MSLDGKGSSLPRSLLVADNSNSPDKPEPIRLAEERTDLSEDRTILANERTFAGWFRTGFGAIAIGLGFHALFNRMEPGWVPRAISTAFLVIGIALFAAAERRACKVIDRLNVHRVVRFKSSQLRLLALLASLGAIALIAAVWLLPIEPAN